MPERIIINAVAAAVEAVSGTDQVPTLAANAVRTANVPMLQVNYLEDGSREDEQHAGMGVIGFAAAAGMWGQVDIVVPLKGAGADYFTATNVPEGHDVFLRAAGFSATVTGLAGAGVRTYTTLDAGNFETASVYCWGQGKLYKLIGCIALPKLSAERAKRGLMTYTVIGKIASITEASPAAPTYSNVIPPLFHSQQVAIGAFTSATNPPLVVEKFESDFGAQHTERGSAGATDGLVGFIITNRKVALTGQIEVVPLGTFDPFTLGKQAAAGASGTDTRPSFKIGSTAFNRITFNFGQWAFRAPTPTEKSGLCHWTLAGAILARSIQAGAGMGRELAITFD